MHQMFTSLHYREPTEYRQNVNVQGQATGAHLLGGIDKVVNNFKPKMSVKPLLFVDKILLGSVWLMELEL